MEELQKDMDHWLIFYNNERSHSGRYCLAKHPCKLSWTAKDVNNLFGQTINFKLSGESDTGSAEVQPARYSLMDGNNKAVEKTSTALQSNYFYPHT